MLSFLSIVLVFNHLGTFMKLFRIWFVFYLVLVFPLSVLAGEVREPEHAKSEVVNKSFKREEAPRLRVATLNMAAGRISDLASIAKAMLVLDADIIAIQEVDRGTMRSGNIDQVKKLAELSGLNVVFGKAIEFDGGDYGLAVASKHPIESSKTQALESGSREGRIVMMAKVSVPTFEHPVTVFNTHLDPDDNPEMRLGQARQLNKWTMNQRGIKLLLGDVNDVPLSGTYQELRRFWVDACNEMDDRRTWPAVNPEINVDYVFSSPAQKWEVRPVELSVFNSDSTSWLAITDHLPVVVDMILLEQ